MAWALVTLLSLCQVDVGAKILGLLMLVEVLCLLVTAAAIQRYRVAPSHGLGVISTLS